MAFVLIGYLCFPAHGSGPGPLPQFLCDGPSPNLYLATPAGNCIYQPWLVRIRNNKRQRLHVMSLSLFLTVIVERNETK